MAYSWFESFTSVNFSLDALLELHQDVCVCGVAPGHMDGRTQGGK